MRVAERHRQSIRRIVRAGDAFEPQQICRNQLDLLFVRPAVTGEGLLDLHRRIFVQPAALFDARQESHAARMCHRDARRDVFAEKQLLHRYFVGRKFVEHFIDPLFEDREPGGQPLMLGGEHYAVVDGARIPVFVLFQYPVSERCQPGVNA